MRVGPWRTAWRVAPWTRRAQGVGSPLRQAARVRLALWFSRARPRISRATSLRWITAPGRRLRSRSTSWSMASQSSVDTRKAICTPTFGVCFGGRWEGGRGMAAVCRVLLARFKSVLTMSNAVLRRYLLSFVTLVSNLAEVG